MFVRFSPHMQFAVWKRKRYESQSVYDSKLYSPETYIFFNKNNRKDGLSLEITGKEYDENRINTALDIYREFITSPYPHIIQ